MKRFALVSLSFVLSAAVLAFAQQNESSKDKPSAQSGVSGLPLNFERHTGDLDAMVKRGSIRALVLYSRSGFFYVDGKPEGISYEALQYFEQFVNQTLRTRQHVQVTFIPVRPDQLESYLNEGIGDLIAYPMAMTPKRAQQVAFSIPIQTNVKQILVTGKDFGPVTSLQDLGGKKVFVSPVTTYYGNLETVNASLRKQGKPPILIESADKNLLDEDLMAMVNPAYFPQPSSSRSAPSCGPAFFTISLLSPISSLRTRRTWRGQSARTTRSSKSWWMNSSRPTPPERRLATR
jgi:ABC-type amino acid transport substrate-binding protein